MRPGYSFGLIGPPKSGKTHAALTTRGLPGYRYAFVAPVGEITAYDGSGIVAEPYYDDQWRPSEKKFVSTGYQKMMDKVKELEQRTDLERGVVIFDTFNRGPSELIWHYCMSHYGTDDPRELGGNSRQPYVTYASRMTELLERLDLLRWRTGCHVVLTFHEDIREAEGVGVPRKETEAGKTVLHWDVARLPMLRGAMRQDIGGWPDVLVFCEPVLQSNPYRCMFRVIPDATRAAGSRLKIMQELQKLKDIPNDISKLIEIADQVYRPGRVQAELAKHGTR